jgi:hypothetical protein
MKQPSYLGCFFCFRRSMTSRCHPVQLLARDPVPYIIFPTVMKRAKSLGPVLKAARMTATGGLRLAIDAAAPGTDRGTTGWWCSSAWGAKNSGFLSPHSRIARSLGLTLLLNSIE